MATENPYRMHGAGQSHIDAWDHGRAAGVAAERERIVKLLREEGADRMLSEPLSQYDCFRIAADLIERGPDDPA